MMLLIIGTLNAQLATLPFTENGLVFIQVQLNGEEEKLNFVFDTGASTTVLDKAVAKRLGIEPTSTQNAQGASGSQKYEIATGHRVHVQGITLDDLYMVLVDLSVLSQRSGMALDGIIGYDILKRYITQFNFETKTIQLYENIDEVSNLTSFDRFPMKFKNTPIPYMTMEYTLANGNVQEGDFLFDSGANATILFNTPYAKKHNLIHNIGKTIEGKARGLTQTSDYVLGSISALQFENYSFSELPVQLATAKSGVSASKAYAGILGAKIINRWNMVLDYKGRHFYLKPNDTYSNAFEFPLSGFSLEKKKDKVMIAQLVEGSDAHKKGVEEGDELLAIDDFSTQNVKSYRDLLKKEHKTIQLTLRKASGKVEKITIRLQRLI